MKPDTTTPRTDVPVASSARADTLDAKRYRWLRDRIEIREQEAMSGKRKPGLWVAMGMTFLDCNTVRTSAHVQKKAAELDAAIDAAISEGEQQ